MSLAEALTGSRLAIIVAAAIVAAVLLAVNTNSINSNGLPTNIPRSVAINLEGRNITIVVQLPGPQQPQYQYYYYYYYYYQQPIQPIPVRTLVVLERMLATGTGYVPELLRLQALTLVAYGKPHNATFMFYGLEPGHYRVSVLFWNELLYVLSSEGKVWKPLAKMYVWEGDIS